MLPWHDAEKEDSCATVTEIRITQAPQILKATLLLRPVQSPTASAEVKDVSIVTHLSSYMIAKKSKFAASRAQLKQTKLSYSLSDRPELLSRTVLCLYHVQGEVPGIPGKHTAPSPIYQTDLA